jgi:hypothetical protein
MRWRDPKKVSGNDDRKIPPSLKRMSGIGHISVALR